MVTLPSSVRIYLATGWVDMRKSIDGLSAVVQSQWRLDAQTLRHPKLVHPDV